MGGGVIYLEGGIGITADPSENSYDPPLMTFSKPVKIPMTPLPSIYEYDKRDMHYVYSLCILYIGKIKRIYTSALCL